MTGMTCYANGPLGRIGRSLVLCGAIPVVAFVGARVDAQGVTVPRMIDHEGLERITQRLEPSEAQRREIERLHGEYLDQWTASFQEDIQTLNASWSRLYVPPHEFAGNSMAAQFDQTKAMADRLRYRLKGANDALFDQIEFILAETQADGLLRARMGWQRHSVARSKRGIPEKGIDLVNLSEQLELSPEERARVDAFWLEHEIGYVATLKDAAEADERRAAVEFEILDMARPFGENEYSPEAKVAIEALRARVGRLGLGAWKRVIDTNRRLLTQLRPLLSTPSAEALERAYLEHAYPKVYPDVASADDYYALALALPDMEAEQSQALAAMRDTYHTRHAGLSRRMREAEYRRALVMQSGVAADRPEAAVQGQRVIEAGIEREELNLAQPAIIRSLLLPEQVEALGPWQFDSAIPRCPWNPSEDKRRHAAELAAAAAAAALAAQSQPASDVSD